MVVALALTIPVSLPVRSATADLIPETIPLDMVVAVDESGSLSAADVSREVEASTTIARSVLNPLSRVTVLGFGSNNGAAGQRAVDEICRPTVADSDVSLQYLSTCVKGLHLRTKAEGNDTDHVAVLAQALSTMRDGSPRRALKVIFLLTDGRLDVPFSPSYGSGLGTDPRVRERRNEAAEQQLTTLIGQAQQAGVQIWPLGFGAAVTQDSLDRFAIGGSREGCDERGDSQPKARVVRDARDVTRSLYEAYAAATCSGLSRTDSGTLKSGQSRDLTIDIPVIATDGTITVSKSDPRVLAQFIDPNGRVVPGSGQFGDSSFARSGENTATEALRIVNPVNGTWTVRLKAPERLADQLVSATALWQGAVQAAIVPEPPFARTGQNVRVWLSLITRKGAITDEEALRGLAFSVTAAGGGLLGQQSIQLRDDGETPDDRANDGRYAGTFQAPQTAGDITLTGVVAGTGIRAERVPITVKVGAPETVTQGRVEFFTDGTVRRGTTIRGRLTMRNATSSARRVRLQLDGDTAADVAPAAGFELPPGDSVKDFVVRFGANAALGGATLTVRLVDERDQSAVYASGLLTVAVAPPETFWDRYRGQLAAAAVALLLLALTLWQWRLAWKRRVHVKGLHAALSKEGVQVGGELPAPTKWSPEFRFTIRDANGYDTRLVTFRSGAGEPCYSVRRDKDVGVLLRTPDGDRHRLAFGAESELLPSGHRLVFRDNRRRRALWPRDRRRSAPRPGTERPQEERQKTVPDYDDPWA
ncbi:vWA domain-containing protein [Sphaerisporangium corydalis]|uniref:Choice-of-anchor X domain-containing protein n=1 Tax=Sphaerisporangium corydalis TaxID=1441875 RepID=A0ABV9ET09_9ACTN|nr:vWA domain-containing protein [Sphaerisporangium corydalis]